MFSEGVLEETKGLLDVAIEGDGFLSVLLPDGSTAYTRDGHMLQDANGRLVTAQGYPIMPEISIPTDALSVGISRDGVVAVQVAGSETASRSARSSSRGS